MKRLLLIALLAMSAPTKVLAVELESAQFCISHYSSTENVEEITEEVMLSGEPFIMNSWLVPYSVITVEFLNRAPLVWSTATIGSENLMALGDWIETAEVHEAEFGFRTFGFRTSDGRVWLVSQFVHEDEFGCFAQPLDH